MSRRASPSAGATVSLFPFLAVLLCTMGALILVLVVIARRAQQQAAEKAREQTAGLQESLEELEWRASVLEGSRQQTRAAFERARNELAYLEARIRELGEQLAQRQAAAEELLRSAGRIQHERTQAEAELARLRQELDLARRRLEEERQAAAARPRSFAIVPYQGQHGTRRRPVYFECTGDSVLIQPEGVRFSAEDFQALGPGNPLAAAMRATREYVVTQQGTADDPGFDPYPLLLVRPGGVAAYYVARAALESYGGDFGYELIDADWKLAFPPPDPHLAQVQRLAADEARRRFRVLALAAPRLYGRGGSGSGGFESAVGIDQARREVGGYAGADGAGLGPGDGALAGSGSSVAGRPPGWALRGSAGGGRWSSHGEQDLLADGRGGPEDAGSEALAGRSGFDPVGGSQDDGAGNAPGGEHGGLLDATAGAFHGQDEAPSGLPSSEALADAPQAANPLGSGTLAEGASTPRGSGRHDSTDAGPPGDRSSAAGAGDSVAGEVAGSQRAPHASTAGGGQPTAAGEASDSMLSLGGPSGGAQPPPGVQGPRTDREARPRGGRSSGQDSFEKSRGENWALRGQPPVSVPVGRPVRIECAADKLTIRPEKRGAEPVVIPLTGATADAVDSLVAAVWDEVDTWGFAGNGFVWRPELRLDVQPGGQGRFEDLRALMAGSGLEVGRATAASRAAGQARGQNR
jgi:hypothetical protein